MPGPNVLVIVSTSLLAGKARGLQTVVGTSLAMLIQLAVAAIGTTWFLSLLSEGLFWLKWLGVTYLVFLGINSLYYFFRKSHAKPPSALGSFQRGFWVSLTNPKTILFFSAFLPQFVTDSALYFQQIVFLSLSFLVLAILIDCGYAMLTAKTRWLLAKHDLNRIQNGASGALYIAASGILAGSNRL